MRISTRRVQHKTIGSETYPEIMTVFWDGHHPHWSRLRECIQVFYYLLVLDVFPCDRKIGGTRSDDIRPGFKVSG